MTLLETLLAGSTALATLFAALQGWRLSRLRDAATRISAGFVEVRAALEFVSEGYAFPRDAQFAGAVLDGNDLALRQTFPAWHDYREQARETERND